MHLKPKKVRELQIASHVSIGARNKSGGHPGQRVAERRPGLEKSLCTKRRGGVRSSANPQSSAVFTAALLRLWLV